MKTILITGVSRGIGLATAKHLLAEGHQVIGIARTCPSELSEQDCAFTFYQVDLSDAEHSEKRLKTIVSQHVLDVVICNAGYGQFKSLESFSVDDMQRMMQVNFMGHAVLLKYALPMMKQRQQGQVIFIGSEASLQGAKFASIYAASKFALRGFAQSIRAECQTAGVVVSSIFPGMTRSQFYEDLAFAPGDDATHAIEPELIAEWVNYILNTPLSCVPEELVLNPLKKVIQKK